MRLSRETTVFFGVKDKIRRTHSIPKGCFDVYEVKVNKDIFQYQKMVKVIPDLYIFFSMAY